MKVPALESERLVYKPLTLKYLTQSYVDWLNDFDVYRYLETGGDYTLAKLKAYLSEVERKEIYFWAIHLRTSGRHIGNIKIDPIHDNNTIGEYGIMMGEKSEWGKGYSKEATLRIIKFCFEVIGLKQISLGLVKENIVALNLYKKVGFEMAGEYRKGLNYHGQQCDYLRMVLHNREAGTIK